MNEEYRKKLENAYQQRKSNREFLKKLGKKRPAQLDKISSEAHDEAFQKIDCLSCANCCKTTSPIFRDIDIQRIARSLKMKPGEFIETWLRKDEDGDWVLRSSPCSFLQEDNTCSIYEDRPQACREYPHTDRKNMYQIMDLTWHNTLVCPAVNDVVENLKKALG